MNLVRIATVKSSGMRYVVQQLDFRTNQCHTFGELMAFDTKKASRQYEGVKKFDLSEVSIQKDVQLTTKLLDELFEQSLKVHEAEIAEGKFKTTSAKYRK